MADHDETTTQSTATTHTTSPEPPNTTAAKSSSTSTTTTPENTITLTIHHANQPHTLTFPSTATLADLSNHITTHLSIPESSQKYLISPLPGLLKPPFTTAEASNSQIPITTLAAARKITLLGSTPAQLTALNASAAAAQKQNLSYRERVARGPVKAAVPAPSRDWKTIQDASTYTFLQLKPLEHLPRPERSLAFLERLRSDPGIKSTMAKHKWSVPLLTEMDPAEHTTHESRTLGLNRNRGEVIELRLRTDAYDGYRDYRTIRKTLCHELAHNVWGEHDGRFWKLCREVEGEVERGDTSRGGRSVGGEEYYEGASGAGVGEGDMVADHGGWTGGSYVLGGSGSGGGVSGADSGGAMGRREVLARAAEERARKLREQQRHG